MADSQTFWNSTFWATGFWSDDFWAGGVAPTPTVDEPTGGGRRIYDPDDKRQRNKSRKLRKHERDELDRMFAQRVAPRYVAPRPAGEPPVRRVAPVVVPAPPPPEKPLDRVVAAKQFMALDALDDFLAEREREAEANARTLEIQHIRAKQHARFLEQEQQRIANEAVQAELQRVEAVRVAEAEAEAFRLAEIQRIADEEEMEMIDLLLAVHDGRIG